MTEYLNPGHLDEKDMSPEYRQAEEAYRAQATQLWERNQSVTEQYRSDLEADQEEREEKYRAFYTGDLHPKFEELASGFVGPIMRQRGEDERTLTHGQGADFASHLVAVNSAPPEGLGDLLTLAENSNQPALAQAVATVALSKNQFGVFDRWAKAEPERAAALKRLRSTPDLEQLVTRANAMRPPKSKPDQLRPGPKEREQSAEEARVERARRRRAQQESASGSWSDAFGNRFNVSR